MSIIPKKQIEKLENSEFIKELEKAKKMMTFEFQWRIIKKKRKS